MPKSNELENYFVGCLGCWIWKGRISDQGYAYLSKAPLFGTPIASRASYIAHRGPIADDLQCDHLCRVRCCINPEHLDPVTAAENMRRAVAARRAEHELARPVMVPRWHIQASVPRFVNELYSSHPRHGVVFTGRRVG